jgi:exonuclease SbcC
LTCLAESRARRDYAADILKQLAQVETAIADVGYDEVKHQDIKNELKELEGFESRGRALEEALRALPEELSRAEKAQQMIAEVLSRQAQDSNARTELLGKLVALPELEQVFAQTATEERGLSTQHHELQQRLGSLQERLSHLEAMASKIKERQRALALIKHHQGLFDELALAFGKKGIQAMLIETALPEIEDGANRLLARMTDGRMNVSFETQRDTKKGDIAETLDIKIADELGTRSYEMFSGGEAFRIDFAIRIALSRLLARRAGAPLPTIIIDEGFGTQDADGIDKLKEAIGAIQTEFLKIIVITHIEELKDAFPVRINVVKTINGSRIEVNEG